MCLLFLEVIAKEKNVLIGMYEGVHLENDT